MHGRFDGALNYLLLSTSTGQARRHDQVRHRDKQQQQLHYQNREEEKRRRRKKKKKNIQGSSDFQNAKHSRLLMLGRKETERKRRRRWRKKSKDKEKSCDVFEGTQSAHSTPSKIQMDCIIIPRLGSLMRTLDSFPLLIAHDAKSKRQKKSERPEEVAAAGTRPSGASIVCVPHGLNFLSS